MSAIPVPPPAPRNPNQQAMPAGARAGPAPAPPGWRPQVQQVQQAQPILQGQQQQSFQLPMRPHIESVRISDLTPHKLLDDDYAKKHLTNFRAFTIRKLPVKDPKKEKTTWARVEVMEERIADAEILKEIKKHNQRQSVADKKAKLADFQTRQVNKILDELLAEEFDPNFDWSLAQIDQKFRIPKSGIKETTTLTIYVKRAPKPGQNPLHLYQAIERNKAEAEHRQRQQQQHQQQMEIQQRQHQLVQQQQAMQHQQQQQQQSFANSKIPMPMKMISGGRKEKKYRGDSSSSSEYDSDSSQSSGYSSSQGTSLSSRSHGRAKKYHKANGRGRSGHREHRKSSLDARDPRLYNTAETPIPRPTTVVDPYREIVDAARLEARLEAELEREFQERRVGRSHERLIPRVPERGAMISYGPLRRESMYAERPPYMDRGERIFPDRRDLYREAPRYHDDRFEDRRDEEYRTRRAEEYIDRGRRASMVGMAHPFAPRRVVPSPPSPMSHSSY